MIILLGSFLNALSLTNYSYLKILPIVFQQQSLRLSRRASTQAVGLLLP